MFEAAAIQPFSPIALFTANAASHPGRSSCLALTKPHLQQLTIQNYHQNGQVFEKWNGLLPNLVRASEKPGTNDSCHYGIAAFSVTGRGKPGMGSAKTRNE